MTEALITELAKIRALKVISRTSSMRFKDTDKPLPVVARELGAEAIVEGSVLRADVRVRISGQLIEASSDEHLWAESYERDMRNILSLQSDVARAIAREVGAILTPEEMNRLERRPQGDPDSHDAYTKGRYYYNKWDFAKAIEHLRRAIDIDPASALAHLGSPPPM